VRSGWSVGHYCACQKCTLAKLLAICFKPYSTYISCQMSELFTLLKIVQVRVCEATDRFYLSPLLYMAQISTVLSPQWFIQYWHSFSLYIGSSLRQELAQTVRLQETWCKRFSKENMLTKSQMIQIIMRDTNVEDTLVRIRPVINWTTVIKEWSYDFL